MEKDDELAPNGMPRIDVHLSDTDGNAFALMGKCQIAMRNASYCDIY